VTTDGVARVGLERRRLVDDFRQATRGACPPEKAASKPGVAADVRGEQPRLTTVVPTYNRRGPLREALAGLSRQSYPSHLFEVVVVVDGSTDGSAELARSLETPYELRIVEQRNSGLAASRNRGAKEAREELLIFMDDDLVPETQFLEAHVAGHEAGGAEHVVLGSCPPASDRPGLWPSYFRAIWDRHYRCKAEPQHRWTYADIVGGNCSLRRSVVLDSGGWDERFSRREDWELGLRLLKDGASFEYRPEARAWHRSESTLASELRKRQVEGRDDVYFASKHPHLKAQLPLEAYARVGGTLKGRLLFRHRRVVGSAISGALPLASALEVLRLRRPWLRLVDRLLASAYFLGIAESLESPEQLTEFLAPVVRGELVETLEVNLGREGCLQVPPAVGALDLVVRSVDQQAVRVRALMPEGQWEWAAIEERLVQAVGDRRMGQ
jgi:glycosyltransferase involved in cell wall biosynthesis